MSFENKAPTDLPTMAQCSPLNSYTPVVVLLMTGWERYMNCHTASISRAKVRASSSMAASACSRCDCVSNATKATRDTENTADSASRYSVFKLILLIHPPEVATLARGASTVPPRRGNCTPKHRGAQSRSRRTPSGGVRQRMRGAAQSADRPRPRRTPVQSASHLGSAPRIPVQSRLHLESASHALVQSVAHLGSTPCTPVQSGPHLEEIRLGAPIDLFLPSEVRDSRAFDRLSRISRPPTRAIGGPSRISSR